MSSDKEEELDLKFNDFEEDEAQWTSSEEEVNREGKKSAPAILYDDGKATDIPAEEEEEEEEEERTYLSRSLPIPLKNKESEDYFNESGTSVSFAPRAPLFDFSPVKGKNQRLKSVVPPAKTDADEETPGLKK